MSRSLSTSIVYGYDIGGMDEGWKFKEYDDENYIMHWPAWVTLEVPVFKEDTPQDPEDLNGEIEDRLKDVGITSIELYMNGANDYDASVLGIELVSGNSLTELNPHNLMYLSTFNGMLERAIEVLGLTPTQPHPKLFMLASYF